MAVSLRTILIVPFVIQVLGITGGVGYLSYRSGQRAVQDMASQVMAEMDQRITAQVMAYLQVPDTLAQVNAQVMANAPNPEAAFATLETHFLQQLQHFPEVNGLAITTPSGQVLNISRLPQGETIIQHRNLTTRDGILHRYQGDAQGENRIPLDPIPDYSPHRTPPLYPGPDNGREASQGGWQLVTTLHRGQNHPLLTMVQSQPVYDRQRQLQGVSSASVLLPELGDRLQRMLPQPTGQVLLLDRQGYLVATSTGEILAVAEVEVDETLPSQAQPQDRQLPWHQSNNPITRAMVRHLINQYDHPSYLTAPAFFTLRLEAQPYFLYISPVPGDLDWLLITAMPGEAFMATIQANMIRTVWICALALVGAIALGIWTATTITQPIFALQRDTETFSPDTDSPMLPGQPSRIKEVNALRQQFDQMVWQLTSSLHTLRHREDTLATFLNGVPVGVSVHAPDGNLLFLNQKGHEILPMGIRPTTLAALPQDYSLYLAGTDTLYPVADFPVSKGLRGKAAYADNLEVEVDGRRIPLEVHTIPVFNDQNQVRYCIAAFQDITERRQAEALRANYERELEQRVADQTASIAQGNATKQALINAIPDLLLRMGRDGIPLEIYNLKAANWIGDQDTAHLRSTYEELPATLAVERQDCIEVALATGTIQRQEYELTIDGQKYWEESRIIPVTQDEVLVVIRDMSERHKIDRIKDEFIAMVSHELRTPLTAIRGALGILDSGVLQNRPDKAQHMLNVSLSNTDRLIRLVNDILNLERLASGKVKLAKEVCPVSQLIQQATEAVESLALEANITIHNDVIPVAVWAAPDAIVQTLVNLLSNAIKFSPLDSHIWIRVDWHSPTTVRFAVADQGRGIPTSQCQVVFDRFQQVDRSDAHQWGGTGLGLAICKNIITQHGGDIWVESTLGEGSTFYFTLSQAEAGPAHG